MGLNRAPFGTAFFDDQEDIPRDMVARVDPGSGTRDLLSPSLWLPDVRVSGQHR